MRERGAGLSTSAVRQLVATRATTIGNMLADAERANASGVLAQYQAAGSLRGVCRLCSISAQLGRTRRRYLCQR